ncbi:MAG: hypothetical protein PHN48_00215 [Parabacteroides sp.]|nr:hypothetical protein [Parabacteroides sp.]
MGADEETLSWPSAIYYCIHASLSSPGHHDVMLHAPHSSNDHTVPALSTLGACRERLVYVACHHAPFLYVWVRRKD